jgi:hypothetical protein
MLGPVDLARLGWCHRRLGAFSAARFAERDSAKVADDADKSPAVGARIAFGCALLVTAGTAHHKISFAQILRHQTYGLGLIKANLIR